MYPLGEVLTRTREPAEAQPGNVRTPLQLYGVMSAERDVLIQLAMEARYHARDPQRTLQLIQTA